MINFKKSLTLGLVAIAASSFVISAQAVTTNGFANGGFETAGGVLDPAASWIKDQGGYTRSTDAHTGSFAALLTGLPQAAPAAFYQNSVSNGGLADLTAGDAPQLSFWAKGAVLFTGNAKFKLEYLDSIGNILGGMTAFQDFKPLINNSTWTQITLAPNYVVPVGATAALVRFLSENGPVIPGFDGTLTQTSVLIDDVYLGVVGAVPEPESYAMLMAGLGGIGFMIRRRRPQ